MHLNAGDGTFSLASNPNGNDPLLTALGWAHAILLVDYDNDGDIDVLLSMRKCDDSSSLVGPPSYNLLKNGGSATSGDISGVFSGVDAGIAAGLDRWVGAWGDVDSDGDMCACQITPRTLERSAARLRRARTMQAATLAMTPT